MQLNGRICIVTGAARGIGAAIARAMVAEGATVVATDVDLPALAASLSDLPAQRISLHAHDVADESQWAALMVEVAERWGGLDVLVNNAGIAIRCDIESMTLAQWRRICEVNLDGTFLGTQHALRLMKSPQRRAACTGSIINLSSIGGLRGTAGLAAYCATKGGVRLFTKATAAEVGRYGIRANSIHPGVIETEMGLSAIRQRLAELGEDVGQANEAAAANPLGRVGLPQDIAGMAVFLASDASSFITGAEMVVDGGVTAR